MSTDEDHPAPPLLRAEELCGAVVESGGLLRRARPLESLAGVDLVVPAGQTLAIVGDLASGRRLLGRMLAGTAQPTSGRVLLSGVDVTHSGALRPGERVMLLGPEAPGFPRRRRVRALLVEALGAGRQRAGVDAPDAGSGGASGGDGSGDGGAAGGVSGGGVSGAGAGGSLDVEALVAAMELDLAILDRTAASLGLREAQRVATALAAARGVALAVCDEPVADPDGLDLALALLARTRTYGATVVLAEGLRGLPEAVERIVVLHGGRVIEDLPRPAMADLALHPATHALLRDAGLLEPGSDGGGTHDSHAEVADACVYRALCPRAQPRCSAERPELARPLGAGHVVACHFPEAPAGPTGAATAPMAPQPPAPAWAAEPTGRDFAEG